MLVFHWVVFRCSSVAQASSMRLMVNSATFSQTTMPVVDVVVGTESSAAATAASSLSISTHFSVAPSSVTDS